MMDKDKLKEDTSMFGLPKIKRIRLKVKKEKVEEAKTAAETAPAATVETKPQESQQAAAKGKK